MIKTVRYVFRLLFSKNVQFIRFVTRKNEVNETAVRRGRMDEYLRILHPNFPRKDKNVP